MRAIACDTLQLDRVAEQTKERRGLSCTGAPMPKMHGLEALKALSKGKARTYAPASG